MLIDTTVTLRYLAHVPAGYNPSTLCSFGLSRWPGYSRPQVLWYFRVIRVVDVSQVVELALKSTVGVAAHT